jgi:DNA polymerase III sliding clamp (beta) subunit (PCNA family)
MQSINREELLFQLESVQGGLSKREIIEQSACFVFKDGEVMTFNDEVACSCKCSLPIVGAVQADPLLAILRKLPEDEITIEETDGELVIVGKRRRAGIRRENEVLLPVSGVEKPGKWRSLPADFQEAISMVQHCTGSDESQFVLTCVHIHPEYIEACDKYQITRATLATGVKTATLVRGSSLKHITSLGMTQVSETGSWIHFRNPSGLVLSCRRYQEEYPNLNSFIDFKGHPITLPKGLGDAADKAKVFTTEGTDESQVLVQLRPGKIRIRGEGAAGYYQEVKKLAYDGPNLEFMVAPELLIEITKKHNDAEIDSGRLKVDGGKWIYVTALGAVAEKADDTAGEASTEE